MCLFITESCDNLRVLCQPCLMHQLNSVTLASWILADGGVLTESPRRLLRLEVALLRRCFICRMGRLDLSQGCRRALIWNPMLVSVTPMVFQLELVPGSSGGLVKTQCAAPRPQFLTQQVLDRAWEYEFLINPQGCGGCCLGDHTWKIIGLPQGPTVNL